MSGPRELVHIQQEYSQALARMGEITYMVDHSFPLELEQIVKKVRRLEQEAKQLKSKPAEEVLDAKPA